MPYLLLMSSLLNFLLCAPCILQTSFMPACHLLSGLWAGSCNLFFSLLFYIPNNVYAFLFSIPSGILEKGPSGEGGGEEDERFERHHWLCLTGGWRRRFHGNVVVLLFCFLYMWYYYNMCALYKLISNRLHSVLPGTGWTRTWHSSPHNTNMYFHFNFKWHSCDKTTFFWYISSFIFIRLAYVYSWH